MLFLTTASMVAALTLAAPSSSSSSTSTTTSPYLVISTHAGAPPSTFTTRTTHGTAQTTAVTYQAETLVARSATHHSPGTASVSASASASTSTSTSVVDDSDPPARRRRTRRTQRENPLAPYALASKEIFTVAPPRDVGVPQPHRSSPQQQQQQQQQPSQKHKPPCPLTLLYTLLSSLAALTLRTFSSLAWLLAQLAVVLLQAAALALCWAAGVAAFLALFDRGTLRELARRDRESGEEGERGEEGGEEAKEGEGVVVVEKEKEEEKEREMEMEEGKKAEGWERSR